MGRNPGYIDPLSAQTPIEVQIQKASIKRKGKTLLQVVAEEGATECAKFLCKAGAKDATTYLAYQLVGDDSNSE